MRIRTIKPEFWTSETLAPFPDFTKLLAIGLLNYADDHGYFWANPVLIRSQIFPFLDSSKTLLGAIQDLSSVGYIRLGVAEDGVRQVGQVVNFDRHQRVDKPKPSIIAQNCTFQDVSKTTPRTIKDASKEEGKGRERKGKGTLSQATGDLESTCPAGSDHQIFISGWTQAFREVRGFDYAFDGGKDAKAVKDLLALGIPVPELLNIAVAAWNRDMTDKFCKASKRASAIHSFRHAFNEIRSEVSAALPAPEDHWPEDTRTPEEYAAAKRKAMSEAMS